MVNISLEEGIILASFVSLPLYSILEYIERSREYINSYAIVIDPKYRSELKQKSKRQIHKELGRRFKRIFSPQEYEDFLEKTKYQLPHLLFKIKDHSPKVFYFCEVKAPYLDRKFYNQYTDKKRELSDTLC